MSSMRIGSQLPVVPAAQPAAAKVSAPVNTVVPAQVDSHEFAAAVGAPNPLPDGQPAKAYDGAILGGDGKSYPAGSVDNIPTFKPAGGVKSNETIVLINGIGQGMGADRNQCQQLANASGAQVIGIDNASEGSLKDLIQSAGDIMHMGGDQCVNSLSKVIFDKMMSGQPLHLMGYSQGAIITSRAISDAQNRMMLEGGMSQAQAQAKMHSLLKVETVGGAAPKYPSGPEYVHYLNSMDPVERSVGLEGPLSKDAGAGAKFVKFSSGFEWNVFNAHHFDKYLAHYKPFDQAYNS